MPSKGVDATTEPKNVEVKKASPLKRFVAILELEASEDSRDTTAFVEDILNRMIEAETVEDAIQAQDKASTSGKDLVDVEMEIQWFSIVKSSDKYKSPLGHYILVEKAVRLDTLEPITFSTGSANIIIPLWKARDGGRLPLQCVIRSRDTSNGELLTLQLLTHRPITVPDQAKPAEPGF